MSKTLTQARAKVVQYFDDDVVGTDANVDDALNVAQHAVYLQASSWAPQRFTVETSVTTSASGVGDLSSLDPVRIVAVNEVSGQSRFPIVAASLSDGPTNILGARTLKIAYIPKLTFPASASDPFVWGQSALDIPLLDDLMCLHAASHLSLLVDQGNKQLERRIEVMEAKAQNIMGFNSWRVLPLRSPMRDSGLAYVMTDAVSLQIVRV